VIANRRHAQHAPPRLFAAGASRPADGGEANKRRRVTPDLPAGPAELLDALLAGVAGSVRPPSEDEQREGSHGQEELRRRQKAEALLVLGDQASTQQFK